MSDGASSCTDIASGTTTGTHGYHEFTMKFWIDHKTTHTTGGTGYNVGDVIDGSLRIEITNTASSSETVDTEALGYSDLNLIQCETHENYDPFNK